MIGSISLKERKSNFCKTGTRRWIWCVTLVTHDVFLLDGNTISREKGQLKHTHTLRENDLPNLKLCNRSMYRDGTVNVGSSSLSGSKKSANSGTSNDCSLSKGHVVCIVRSSSSMFSTGVSGQCRAVR